MPKRRSRSSRRSRSRRRQPPLTACFSATVRRKIMQWLTEQYVEAGDPEPSGVDDHATPSERTCSTGSCGRSASSTSAAAGKSVAPRTKASTGSCATGGYETDPETGEPTIRSRRVELGHGPPAGLRRLDAPEALRDPRRRHERQPDDAAPCPGERTGPRTGAHQVEASPSGPRRVPAKALRWEPRRAVHTRLHGPGSPWTRFASPGRLTRSRTSARG